jgi:hypothetical protein
MGGSSPDYGPGSTSSSKPKSVRGWQWSGAPLEPPSVRPRRSSRRNNAHDSLDRCEVDHVAFVTDLNDQPVVAA